METIHDLRTFKQTVTDDYNRAVEGERDRYRAALEAIVASDAASPVVIEIAQAAMLGA